MGCGKGQGGVPRVRDMPPVHDLSEDIPSLGLGNWVWGFGKGLDSDEVLSWGWGWSWSWGWGYTRTSGYHRARRVKHPGRLRNTTSVMAGVVVGIVVVVVVVVVVGLGLGLGLGLHSYLRSS